MKKEALNKFSKNVFSQFGEDGIIEEIIKRADIKNRVCVEFGAWDGVLFSNVANLWSNHEWKGILIESEKDRYEDMKKITSNYNCLPINTFVEPKGENSLEKILKKHSVPFKEIEILSIDIDGNEYQIFKNLKELRPTIIILEYNPTIPPEMSIVSKEGGFFGSSAKALCDLADFKGYSLVALTDTNCIFVKKEILNLFEEFETNLNKIFNRSKLTYFITGYSGNYTFSNKPAFGIGTPLKKKDIECENLFYTNRTVNKVRWYRFKDFLKMILKKIVGAENITETKIFIAFIKWIINGKKIPVHMYSKRNLMKKLQKKYNMEIFIETGTAGGATVSAMSKYFKKLYTIELNPTFYHQAKLRNLKNKNVNLIQGNSSEKIEEILKETKDPAIFWLDAHYSGGDTARGEKETPIEEELNAILNHRIKNHVILIDDAREFNGTHDYPTLEKIKEAIKKHPHLKIKVENDIIIIEPINDDAQKDS